MSTDDEVEKLCIVILEIDELVVAKVTSDKRASQRVPDRCRQARELGRLDEHRPPLPDAADQKWLGHHIDWLFQRTSDEKHNKERGLDS